MFKTDPRLFLSASNNISSAKSFINECKRFISQYDDPLSKDDCKKLNENIMGCDIDLLVTKVEETKGRLFELEQSFATEYMTLLQEYLTTSSIDTSDMTDEQRLQYSTTMEAYERDYNTCLLYVLEKYENTGMLTPEMESQLQIQRAIVEQYGIDDQMGSLLPTSQEYIDLYSKRADLDRQIIFLNPNLTDEEKKRYVTEYDASYGANMEVLELNRDVNYIMLELKDLEPGSDEYYDKQNEAYQLQIDYYESRENLSQAEVKQLTMLRDYKELNTLMKNDADFDTIYDKKVAMGIPVSDDDTEYRNMNGFERAMVDVGTFTTSLVLGIGSVGEAVIDGGAMFVAKTGNTLFGTDTQWAEDFTSIHYMEDAYDGLVLNGTLSSTRAYSGWHTAGSIVGTVAGGVMLSYLPGGTAVVQSAFALSAMGSASQKAFDNGATFDEAFSTGKVAATAGFVVGGALSKLGTAAMGAGSLLKVGGYAVAGGATSMLTPIVSSAAEYFNYGYKLVDEDGNALYDDVFDYYVNSGGLKSTVIAFATGFVSVGAKGLLSLYKKPRAATPENKPEAEPETETKPAPDGDDTPKELEPAPEAPEDTVPVEAEPTPDAETPGAETPSSGGDNVPPAEAEPAAPVSKNPTGPADGSESPQVEMWKPENDMTYRESEKVLAEIRGKYGDEKGVINAERLEQLKANPEDYQKWRDALGNLSEKIPYKTSTELKEGLGWHQTALNRAKYFGKLAQTGDQTAQVEFARSIARLGGIADLEECGVFIASSASASPSVIDASAAASSVPDVSVSATAAPVAPAAVSAPVAEVNLAPAGDIPVPAAEVNLAPAGDIPVPAAEVNLAPAGDIPAATTGNTFVPAGDIPAATAASATIQTPGLTVGQIGLSAALASSLAKTSIQLTDQVILNNEE